MTKPSPEEIAKRICKEMSVTELDYEMSCKQFEIPIAEAIRAERECIASVVKQTIDNLPCPKCAQLRDAWCSPECAFKALKAERQRPLPSFEIVRLNLVAKEHFDPESLDGEQYYFGVKDCYNWLAERMKGQDEKAK